jgi:hypothetical protein
VWAQNSGAAAPNGQPLPARRTDSNYLTKQVIYIRACIIHIQIYGLRRSGCAFRFRQTSTHVSAWPRFCNRAAKGLKLRTTSFIYFRSSVPSAQNGTSLHSTYQPDISFREGDSSSFGTLVADFAASLQEGLAC